MSGQKEFQQKTRKINRLKNQKEQIMHAAMNEIDNNISFIDSSKLMQENKKQVSMCINRKTYPVQLNKKRAWETDIPKPN